MQFVIRNGEPVLNGDQYIFHHTGYGVFETLLAKIDPENKVRILGLELHLKRLVEGCALLELPFKKPEHYFETLKSLFKLNNYISGTNVRIRFIVYENEWFLQAEQYQINTASVSLKSVNAERFLPEVKSCSAAASVYSHKLAANEGYDEALMIDNGGFVRETSWGNFFWFDKHKRLNTAADKVLKGVTREIVIKIAGNQFEVTEGEFRREDLKDITNCMISRSTNGLSNVSRLDLQDFSDTDNPVSELQKQYNALYFSDQDLLTVF